MIKFKNYPANTQNPKTIANATMLITNRMKDTKKATSNSFDRCIYQIGNSLYTCVKFLFFPLLGKAANRINIAPRKSTAGNPE